MRVALYTLGCKVNQFESAALSEGFASTPAEIVPHTQDADIYVVNTCAVTSKAAYQSRQILRRLARSREKSRIIATGCYVQVGAQEISDAVPKQVCLIGNDQKDRLVELVLGHKDCLECYVGDISKTTEIAPFVLKHRPERTRAFIRIQDGCNSFCAYCIIPYARGMSRSLAPESAEKQVKVMLKNGIREVVLTGIHIGMYGLDLSKKTSLSELLKRLCSGFPQTRFRLSSIEPLEVTPDMISWARSTPNFCPHWHIPLQSGSDKILALMNRRYTSSHFRNLIRELKESMPETSIGIDVMVGFPGEDQADFEKTLKLISELPVTYVHVFPFSARPGTLAAAMTDTVNQKEKARRGRVIRQLGAEKRHSFYNSQVEKVYECLMEQQDRESGLWRGLTPNYIPVLLETEKNYAEMKNRILSVRITKSKKEVVLGTPIS